MDQGDIKARINIKDWYNKNYHVNDKNQVDDKDQDDSKARDDM